MINVLIGILIIGLITLILFILGYVSYKLLSIKFIPDPDCFLDHLYNGFFVLWAIVIIIAVGYMAYLLGKAILGIL